MTTDAELLKRFVAAGSEAAFAEIVHRHLGMVHGTALRRVGGDAHLAKDVAQAVFVALARKARALRGHRTLAGWLYLSTHHAAAQLVRGEQRRRKREEAHAMHEQLTHDPVNADWTRLRPVLDAAMRELGAADREAVLLRYFEQRPFAAIGAALELSEDAARMRVDRALEKLRGLLARHGITSTAAALGTVLSGQAAAAVPAGLAASVCESALAVAVAPAAGIFASGPFLAAAAVAVVGLGVAVFSGLQQRRAETAVAVARQERDAARGEARDLRASLAAAARAPVNVPSARAESAGAPVPAVATGPASSPAVVTISARRVDGTEIGSIHVENTPEGRRAATRAAVAQTFAAFFQLMGWSQAQQDVFKDLWADRKEAEQAKFAAARAAGRASSKELAREIFAESSQEFDARLRAALGEGVVEAKRDFEAKRPFRFIADEVAKQLFYSSVPLTSPQAERVIEVMAGLGRRPDGKFDLEQVDPAALLVQAQAFLAPAQLEALKTVEAEQRRQRALEARLLAERGTPPAK